MCPIPNGFRDKSYFTVHCTDEQHAMSSHELESALILTEEFSKMYYTRYTVPTFEQEIPVLESVCNISFLSTILEVYSEIALFGNRSE
jgi:hypothetical protein